MQFDAEGERFVYEEKNFRWSAGELYVKMLELEGRIRTMELEQHHSYHKSVAVSMYGLLVGALALGYILIRGYEIWFLLGSVWIAATIFATALWNQSWYRTNLDYLKVNGWQRHEHLKKGFLAGTKFYREPLGYGQLPRSRNP
jgi:hypothetical protein